jgi:hypothetical protein
MAKKVPKANKEKPLMQMAVFCERVIEESDNVVSLMRIVDRVVVSTDKDELPPGIIKLWIAVMFKAGDAIGKRTIKVEGKDPSGDSIFVMQSNSTFEGAGHGTRSCVEAQIPITAPGMHWFDVYVDDQWMTKMPLEIAYRKRAIAQADEPKSVSASVKKKTKSSTKRS